MIIERYAVDLLEFSESVSCSPYGVQLSDFIVFSEDISVSPKLHSSNDLLSFHEGLVVGKSVSKVLSETLIFTEDAKPRVFVFDCQEFLIFNEDMVGDAEGKSFHESLTLVEMLSAYATKTAREQLSLSEELLLQKTSNLLMEETLSFDEGLTVYIPSKKFIADPVAVGSSPIRFKRGTIELEYRKYLFGNSERVTYSRINRKSIGGDLIVGAASDNTVTTLKFTVLLLKPTEIVQLQQFIHDTIGEEIEFRDHENVNWTGVITTPDAAKVQSGRFKYELELEFEGVRV